MSPDQRRQFLAKLPPERKRQFEDRLRRYNRMTPEQRANLEEALGLRDPVVVQYGKWRRDISTGEFGKSLLRGDSVTQFVLRRGPITLEIALLATMLSWLIGFPVGILSALRPIRDGSRQPHVLHSVSSPSPAFGWAS